MHIVKTECPHCGAILDANDESETLYCRYCGCNLLPVVTERADSKTKVRGGIPSNTALTWTRTKLGRIGSTIVVYLIFFSILGIISTCASCVGDVVEDRELEDLEQQIQGDIEDQNYESAYLSSCLLEPTDSASSQKKEHWAQKKAEYQEQIIKLKRERDSTDPSYIPAPQSSDELEGRNFENVAGLFTDAGFTNIKFDEELRQPLTVMKKTGRTRPGHSGYTAVTVPDYGPFTWTRGSVTEIEFGCLSSFTTEDHCKADEEIVIHYHGDGMDPITIQAPDRPEIVAAVPDDQS